MDRDKEEGYFERQALTMDVIDTFVAESAPRRVDLSSGVRERILASEVTRQMICGVFCLYCMLHALCAFLLLVCWGVLGGHHP